jgi:hypothetical protein
VRPSLIVPFKKRAIAGLIVSTQQKHMRLRYVAAITQALAPQMTEMMTSVTCLAVALRNPSVDLAPAGHRGD